MEHTEIERGPESKFQRTIKHALAGGMNLVYTTAERSGVTTALETMSSYDVFGNDIVYVSPNRVVGKRDGEIYLRHLPSLDRLAPQRRNTVFVIDAASKVYVRELIELLTRGDYGSVLLFDPHPSPAVVAAMLERTTIHAYDPCREARAAVLGPNVFRATSVKGKTLCVTRESAVGRTLSLVANMLESNTEVRQSRGRYLLHLVCNMLSKYETEKIVISDPSVLNNENILRSLCQSVVARAIEYGSVAFIDKEYCADSDAFTLYQAVNAELNLYVSQGAYHEAV